MRKFVVHVVRPREREKDVDIQEGNDYSSSALRTRSSVRGGVLGATRKTGKPRFFAKDRTDRAFRARAETARPRLTS